MSKRVLGDDNDDDNDDNDDDDDNCKCNCNAYASFGLDKVVTKRRRIDDDDG